MLRKKKNPTLFYAVHVLTGAGPNSHKSSPYVELSLPSPLLWPDALNCEESHFIIPIILLKSFLWWLPISVVTLREVWRDIGSHNSLSCPSLSTVHPQSSVSQQNQPPCSSQSVGAWIMGLQWVSGDSTDHEHGFPPILSLIHI